MNTAIDTTDWRPVDKFKFFIYDGPRLVAGFHSREERDFILRAAKSFKAALFALQYVRGVESQIGPHDKVIGPHETMLATVKKALLMMEVAEEKKSDEFTKVTI